MTENTCALTCYEPSIAGRRNGRRTGHGLCLQRRMLRPGHPPPAAKLGRDTAAAPANDDADNDDYYLGGYAGI